MDLKVTTSKSGEVSVISVGGEVDLHTAPQLDRALTAVLDEGHSKLVVDLSGVSFLDSTGLGVLVKALKGAREKGGWIHLVVPSERIGRIFEITGLDTEMPRFDTLEAASAG